MTEAPTPNLPRGAGGPPRRATDRVTPRRLAPAGEEARAAPAIGRPAALVLDPDPLAALLVVSAVGDLGFRVPGTAAQGAHDAPAAVFVPLGPANDCRLACAAARAVASPDPGPVVVGYATQPALLAAHRIHRCADLVLRLAVCAGRPCLAHLPATDEVTVAGLSAREADVLVLLLGGLSTSAIAERLCVSASTARTHCRAVLRKLAAGDRRTLRGRLLAGAANFAEEWAVAEQPRGAHT